MRDPGFEKREYILDCDASAGWAGKPKLVCPCLTRSRARGFWNVSRGERLDSLACLRLQGIPAGQVVLPPKDTDVRELAGNSMSLCVVEQLLRAALVSCGAAGDVVANRWFEGSAQADLVRDAWGDLPPAHITDTLPSFVRVHLTDPDSPVMSSTASRGVCDDRDI